MVTLSFPSLPRCRNQGTETCVGTGAKSKRNGSGKAAKKRRHLSWVGKKRLTRRVREREEHCKRHKGLDLWGQRIGDRPRQKQRTARQEREGEVQVVGKVGAGDCLTQPPPKTPSEGRYPIVLTQWTV